MLISQPLSVHGFLDLGIDFKMVPPQVWAFSSFGFEHHYISAFVAHSNLFGTLSCPPALFGHF